MRLSAWGDFIEFCWCEGFKSQKYFWWFFCQMHFCWIVVKWMVEFHNLEKCMHTSVELVKWIKNLLTGFMFILYTDMLLDIWNVSHVEYVNFWIVLWKLQKSIQISCFYLFHYVLRSGLEINTRMLYDWRVNKFCVVVHSVLGISKYVSLSQRVIHCKMAYSSLWTIFLVMLLQRSW